MKISAYCLIGTLIIVHTLTATLHAKAELTPLGWIEESILMPEGLRVRSKLDTGADISSINAENITFFKQQGVRWVRFSITNRYGETKLFERPVRRKAEIKQKVGAADLRPVIRLALCIGNIYEHVEFTLVNRSNFSSTALIGRNFLAGKVVVDSSRNYSTKPNCKRTAE